MKYGFFVIAFSLVFIPVPGNAAVCNGVENNLNLCYPLIQGFSLSLDLNFAQIVGWLYYFVVGVSGLIAFVVIIRGGIQWLASSGNTQLISDAKDRIRNALMGLLLVLSSFLILQFINPDLAGSNFITLPRFEAKKDAAPPPPPPKGDPQALLFVVNGSEEGVNVRPGGTISLLWKAGEGYQRCEAVSDPTTSLWAGNVGTNGAKELSAGTQSQRLELICFRNASAFVSKSLSVTVTEFALEPGSAPIVNLFVSGESLRSGRNSEGPFTLRLDGAAPGDFKDNRVKFVWESNADQCVGTNSLELGQKRDQSGEDTMLFFGPPEFPDGNYTFTITCSGSRFALPSSDSVVIDMKF
ncbi:MAG: hypothetical protein Q8P03_01245 [bacterium]|nr:hypothetical protein [bacterium]